MSRDIRSAGSGSKVYMPQLDGLRFVAIAAVLLDHTFPTFQGTGLGSFGVVLFFVLSGFLITGILLDTREDCQGDASRLQGMKNFYARRVLRIFPIYYLMLAFLYTANAGSIREQIIWHASFLTNEYMARHGQLNTPLNHFWSLAIEEQFYFVWPWIVVWLPRRLLVPACAAVVAIAPVCRYFRAETGMPAMSVGLPLYCCMDTLALGALLAMAKLPPGRFFAGFVRIAGIVGFPAFVVVYAFGRSIPSSLVPAALTTTVALCAVWLVGRASVGFTGLARRFLGYPPVVYVGKISFGVYVYHQLCINFQPNTLFKLNGGPAVVFLSRLTAILGAVAVATLSWYFFERPINRLKDRFRSGDSRGQQGQQIESPSDGPAASSNNDHHRYREA